LIAGWHLLSSFSHPAGSLMCRLAHEPSCALVLLDGGKEALDLAHKLTCFVAHEWLSAAQALLHPFFMVVQ
jgi:hypothetical protein